MAETIRTPGLLDPEQCHLDRPVLREPALQDQLDRDGYVVVPLLTADEVADLYGAYVEAAEADGGINPEGAYNDTYAEFSVIHSHPEFRRRAYEHITRVIVPRAAEHLVDYRPLVANYVNKPPGTGIVPAHQNWSVVDDSRFQSVSVWVALDDCVVENGTMLMGGGSHRVLRGPRGMWAYQAFAPIEDDLVADHLEPVVVSAGEAVILDDAVIHQSPPNRTDARRLAIQLVMLPEEADALFHQQVGGDDELMEVDVWRVEPAFFFDFWHGDGDAAHGELVDHVQVAVPRFDASTLRKLFSGPVTEPDAQSTWWRALRSAISSKVRGATE